MEIELGQHYVDGPTGFSGVATGIARYLSGEDRVQLSSRKDDGTPLEWWFDIGRLTNEEKQ